MKENKKPLVSVLMPAYNVGEFLRESLDSILAQTYTNFEVLLIDDGSTDDTATISLAYAEKDSRIKYYKNEENKGLIYTLNRGLSLVNGAYIARMDADDIMFPDRLEKQVRFMQANPNIAVSGGQMYTFGAVKGETSNPLSYEEMLTFSLINSPIMHPTVIMRTSAVREWGLQYNENYKHAEDYKLWSDVLNTYPDSMANIKDVVLYYRASPTQVSSKYRQEQFDTAKIIRRENLVHLLSHYNISLPQTIHLEVIKQVSSLIKKGNYKGEELKRLIISLGILYRSLPNANQRISRFIFSGDFLWFRYSHLQIKLALIILLSKVFPNKGVYTI